MSNHNSLWRYAAIVGVLCCIGPAFSKDILPVAAFETSNPSGFVLKVAYFNCGAKLESDCHAFVQFSLRRPGGNAFHEPSTALRPRLSKTQSSQWTPSEVAIVRFGRLEIPESTKDEVWAWGGLVKGKELSEQEAVPLLAGKNDVLLGRFVEANGSRQFIRANPLGGISKGVSDSESNATQEKRVLPLAACEQLGPRRFILRVAYFNCGAKLEKDYRAFVHFEPKREGENLQELWPLGLYPIVAETSSTSWRPDEVAVVPFGPFSIPYEVKSDLYLRVGIYDWPGSGERVPLIGEDDGTRRPLVGRLVATDRGFRFERVLPARPKLPD